MKATINGITVEGTPQEIMEYQRLVGTTKVYQQEHIPYWYRKPEITCDATPIGFNTTYKVRNVIKQHYSCE